MRTKVVIVCSILSLVILWSATFSNRSVEQRDSSLWYAIPLALEIGPKVNCGTGLKAFLWMRKKKKKMRAAYPRMQMPRRLDVV